MNPVIPRFYRRALLFAAALSLTFGTTRLARAASTPDWLEPYLTGAAAAWQPREPATVLLNRREVHFLTPDTCAITARGVMRANTQEGIERLNIRLPYNQNDTKILSVRAWIISPKGKTISVSRSEFTDVSSQTDPRIWYPSRALTYAAAAKAEPGSVLAWEYNIESSVIFGETEWSASNQIGLFRGEFEVTPSAHGRLVWHVRDESVPAPTPGTSPGSLVWKIEDRKPIRGARPNGFFPVPLWIFVRCAPAEGDQDTPAKSWAAMSRFLADLFAERAVVTPQIQAVAAAETREKTTRWERVQALAQFVQRKVAYLSINEDPDIFNGCRPHAATDVLSHELGDCKDKATLLVTLLRSIGEDSCPVLVAANRPAAVDLTWPSSPFNHAIVAIPSDQDAPSWWPIVTGPNGKPYVLFDPTARTLPFGCLPPSDQGGRVLLLLRENGGLAEVSGNFPGVPPARVKTTITLDAKGTAKVSEVQERFGTSAGLIQDQIDRDGRERFTRVLEQAVKTRAPGAHHIQWTAEHDALAGRTVLKIDYEIANATRRVGKDQLLFTPPLINPEGPLSPWETSAPGTTWLPRLDIAQEVQITLPEGATVVELPPMFASHEGEAEAKITYASAPGGLTCSQRQLRVAGSYSKSDYQKLQQLTNKFSAAQRHPIILQFASAPVAVATP